jgi:Family of unknown function (DUF5719)
MSPAHHVREARWRILLVVVAVIAGVAIAAQARGTPNPVAPAEPAALVSAPDAESSAWYCTGQSTSTGGSAVGFLVLTNTVARAVTATITTVTDGGATARTAVSVPARGVATPSLPAQTAGSWQADTVTVNGGGVAVSQVIAGSSGWDEVPCQSTTSSQWYFPGGTTANAAGLYLSLLNPTSTPVVVDLTFVTPAGAVHPINYQGVVLQADSVLAENVASEVQNEPTVSTIVTTRTGRVVASEVQVFAATNGQSLVPGVATVQPHWTIPQAEEATGGTSEIDVFNPSTAPERVTARLRLASGPLAPLSDTVAPDTTWVLKTSSQTRIPAGAPYSADVEATGGPGVVVGRTVGLPASAPAAQSGLALAFDGLSQAPSGASWVVPPPGSASRPALPNAAPESLALTNTSSSAERYSAMAVLPTGQTTLAAGTIPAGTTVLVSGSSLARAAFDPVAVRASGTMAVSEDLAPSGGVGVVTMPGIPLAAAIGV